MTACSIRSVLLAAVWAVLVCCCLSANGLSSPGEDVARARLVQHYCHAAEIFAGAAADERARILDRFDPLLMKMDSALGEQDVIVALVDSNEINAHTQFLSPSRSLICLPVAMAQFTGGSEGELVAILAHEFGHAYDGECKNPAARAALVHSQVWNIQQRACESRADTIGFELLVAAGYSPFDMAGAFGRLEMFSGDTRTGILARLQGMLSDHPITPDRIQHMHQLLLDYLQTHQTF